MKYAATARPYGANPKNMGYGEYMRFLQRNKTYVDAYTDVYTGRVLSPEESPRDAFAQNGPKEPPKSAEPPKLPATRRNPLTGLMEDAPS